MFGILLLHSYRCRLDGWHAIFERSGVKANVEHYRLNGNLSSALPTLFSFGVQWGENATSDEQAACSPGPLAAAREQSSSITGPQLLRPNSPQARRCSQRLMQCCAKSPIGKC